MRLKRSFFEENELCGSSPLSVVSIKEGEFVLLNRIILTTRINAILK